MVSFMKDQEDPDAKIAKSTDFKDVFLLTGTYTTNEGDESPTVKLFGRASDGTSVTILVRGFRPYFYVEKKGSGLATLLRRDERVTDVKEIYLRVTPTLQKTFLKVWTKKPSDVADLRKILQLQGLSVYAADILFHLRYMYDMDIGPFIRVTGEQEKGMCDIDGQERWLASSITSIEPFEPQLSILSIDIENSMEREDKKILCCGWVFKCGDREETGILYGEEIEILKALVRLVCLYDPDIITGYNVVQYDLPHLLRRASSCGVGLEIGRDGTLPRPRMMKRDKEDGEEETDSDIERWAINGRVVVDAWKAARAAWHPKRETLDYVARHYDLGVKGQVNTAKIDEEWAANERKVLDYCIQDAVLALRVIEKTNIIFDARFLAQLSQLPLEMCIFPHQSWLIDSGLIRRFDRHGWVVPCMNWGTKKEKKIEGAHVVEPKTGLHEWVLLLDFAAMYPSIMQENNLCYSTFLSEEDKDKFSDVVTSPVGAHFLQTYRGIVPELVDEWIKDRYFAKKKFKETGDPKWDRIQWSIKILLNSIYGLFTSKFYRFTNRQIGESITAFARTEIKGLIANIERTNIILYGDTDSIFVKGPSSIEGCIAMGKAIVATYSHGSMSIDHAATFVRWFTHGKKKKYFGQVIWPKNEYYVRGYAMRRGDSFDYLDEVLEELLHSLVDPSIKPMDACIVASKRVRALLKGKVALEKLIITKSVSDEKDYDKPDGIQGVRAARKLVSYGYRWIPGTKLSWIVTNSTVSPMEVEPWIPERVAKPIPDLTYYAKRVVNTIKDITTLFGYDEDGLYSSTAPTRLESFK